MYFGNLRVILISAIVANCAQAWSGNDQSWYNLKTTFNAIPFKGFFDQPRTVADAEEAGWTLVSDDCEGSFPGKRYAPPSDGNTHEFIMIYDDNGFIAGMHSVISKEAADVSTFAFEKSLWYRLDDSLGYEAYLTTAYFVDPAMICKGRDQTAFDTDGTGNVLWFQHGDDIHKAPVTQDEANANAFWAEHKCFVNMGRHYFNLFYDADADACNADGPDAFTPIQLLYSGGVMNGFVWQHAANPENSNGRWEPVASGKALNFLIDTPPKCILDIVDTVGVVTMHVYFRNYVTLCITES